MIDRGPRVTNTRWGWLLLIVFGAGFAANETLGQVDELFWAFNLMCAGACALLLTRLGRPLDRTLWIWALLAIFVAGYFVKTFVIAVNLPYWQFDAQFFDQLRAVLTARLIASGFRWITLGFVTFCVIAWMLPSARARPDALRRDEEFSPGLHEIRTVLLVSLLLSVVLAALRFVYGIGIHGVEGSGASERLPFRLGTILVRTQEDLLPALTLLCLWAAERIRSGRTVVAALAVSLLNAVAISVVSTSKGTLLFLVAGPVCLLWLLTRRLSARRIGVLVGIAGVMFALYVPLMALRGAQSIEGGRVGASELLAVGSRASAARSIAAESRITAQKLLMRTTGADGVWMCLSRPTSLGPDGRGSLFTSGLTMTEYYSRKVVGRTDLATSDAPGLIAAFMMIGSWPAVMILTSLTVVVVWAGWFAISQLCTRAVAQARAGIFVFSFLSEGTFRYESVVVFVATVVACEWLFRSVLATGHSTTPPSARQVTRWRIFS